MICLTFWEFVWLLAFLPIVWKFVGMLFSIGWDLYGKK